MDGPRFMKELKELVERLSPLEQVFERIKSGGGSACLIVSFLGDGHFGDTLPAAILAKIANLHLDLGVEVFSTPQV